LTKADLDTILFVEQGGPPPRPSDATIRALGCLAHGGSDWSVTRIGEFHAYIADGDLRSGAGAPLVHPRLHYNTFRG